MPKNKKEDLSRPRAKHGGQKCTFVLESLLTKEAKEQRFWLRMKRKRHNFFCRFFSLVKETFFMWQIRKRATSPFYCILFFFYVVYVKVHRGKYGLWGMLIKNKRKKYNFVACGLRFWHRWCCVIFCDTLLSWVYVH